MHGSAWKHFEVKKLTNKGVNVDGKLFYCVKWKGTRQKTWKPAEELKHRCWNLIENYEILHWNNEKAAQSQDKRKFQNWQELLKLDTLEANWIEDAKVKSEKEIEKENNYNKKDENADNEKEDKNENKDKEEEQNNEQTYELDSYQKYYATLFFS